MIHHQPPVQAYPASALDARLANYGALLFGEIVKRYNPPLPPGIWEWKSAPREWRTCIYAATTHFAFGAQAVADAIISEAPLLSVTLPWAIGLQWGLLRLAELRGQGRIFWSWPGVRAFLGRKGRRHATPLEEAADSATRLLDGFTSRAMLFGEWNDDLIHLVGQGLRYSTEEMIAENLANWVNSDSCLLAPDPELLLAETREDLGAIEMLPQFSSQAPDHSGDLFARLDRLETTLLAHMDKLHATRPPWTEVLKLRVAEVRQGVERPGQPTREYCLAPHYRIRWQGEVKTEPRHWHMLGTVLDYEEKDVCRDVLIHEVYGDKDVTDKTIHNDVSTLNSHLIDIRIAWRLSYSQGTLARVPF